VDLKQTLNNTEKHAIDMATHWRKRLTDADRAFLIDAFHRTEFLAQCALEHAIEQVSEQYREELKEQLADEERHVNVFARWRPETAEPVTPPRRRERDEAIWFALLLINEATGYCQFQMLVALLGDPERQAEVRAILVDERIHIARLQRWLGAYVNRPVFSQIETITQSFQRNLPGRMKQFLPRDELAPLRADMATLVSGLIDQLFGALSST